jgi:hypothetical protein
MAWKQQPQTRHSKPPDNTISNTNHDANGGRTETGPHESEGDQLPPSHKIGCVLQLSALTSQATPDTPASLQTPPAMDDNDNGDDATPQGRGNKRRRQSIEVDEPNSFNENDLHRDLSTNEAMSELSQTTDDEYCEKEEAFPPIRLYVSSLLLASRSKFFSALFMNGMMESGQKEVITQCCLSLLVHILQSTGEN